jgi:hypothetical protein
MSDSISHLQGDALLDNPIWSSLVTRHAHLAVGADIGRGLARRYRADIGPLSGFQEPTPEAYADLAEIVPEGDVAALFLKIHPRFLQAGSLFEMERSFRWCVQRFRINLSSARLSSR